MKSLKYRARWDQRIVEVEVVNGESQKEGEEQLKMNNGNKNYGVDAITDNERSGRDHDD